MSAIPERKRSGWSFGEEGHEHLHQLEIIPDPASAAWNEPGYIDPDLHHASLLDGARYWQGYAPSSKRPKRGEERPLSPELVTRITRRTYPDESTITVEEDMDPNWQRRMRSKERNFFSSLRARIWPG